MSHSNCKICLIKQANILLKCKHSVCLKCVRRLEKLRHRFPWANCCPVCRRPFANNRPTGLRTPYNDHRSESQMQLDGYVPIQSDDSVVPPDLRQTTEVFLQAIRQALTDPSNSPFPVRAGSKLTIGSTYRRANTTIMEGNGVPAAISGSNVADNDQNDQNGPADNEYRHNNPHSAFQ